MDPPSYTEHYRIVRDVYGYHCVSSNADISQLIMDDLRDSIYVKEQELRKEFPPRLREKFDPTVTNHSDSFRQEQGEEKSSPFSWETPRPGNLKVFSSTSHHPLTTGRLQVATEGGLFTARHRAEIIPSVKQSCCPSTFLGTLNHQLEKEIEREVLRVWAPDAGSLEGTSARVARDQRDTCQSLYTTNNADNNRLMAGVKNGKDVSFHLENSQRAKLTTSSFSQNRFSPTYDHRFVDNHSTNRWWAEYTNYNMGKIGSVMGTEDTRHDPPNEIGGPIGSQSSEDILPDASPPYDLQTGHNPKRIPKPYSFLSSQECLVKSIGGVLGVVATSETPLAITLPLKEVSPRSVPRDSFHFRRVFGRDTQHEFKKECDQRTQNTEPVIGDPFRKEHPQNRKSDCEANEAWRCNPRVPTQIMDNSLRYFNGDKVGDVFISPLSHSAKHRQIPASEDFVLVMKPPHVIANISMKGGDSGWPNGGLEHSHINDTYEDGGRRTTPFLASKGRASHYVKDSTGATIKIYRSSAYKFALNREDWFLHLPKKIFKDIRTLISIAGDMNCDLTRLHYAQGADDSYPDQDSNNDPEDASTPHEYYPCSVDHRPVSMMSPYQPAGNRSLASSGRPLTEWVDPTGRILKTKPKKRPRSRRDSSGDNESDDDPMRGRPDHGESIRSDSSSSSSSSSGSGVTLTSPTRSRVRYMSQAQIAVLRRELEIEREDRRRLREERRQTNPPVRKKPKTDDDTGHDKDG